MKTQMLLTCLAATACTAPETARPPSIIRQPARYATAEESIRLSEEARKNFEREKLAQSGGGARPEPAPKLTPFRPSYEPRIDVPGNRTRYPAAEVRYAMLIGKHPSELTPGERAMARLE